jgi:hypothetical protein
MNPFKLLAINIQVGFYNIYSSNIIGVIKSKMIKWAGHVARLWEMKNSYEIFVGIPQGKKQVGRAIHIYWRILDLRELYVRAWTGFNWLRTRSSSL